MRLKKWIIFFFSKKKVAHLQIRYLNHVTILVMGSNINNCRPITFQIIWIDMHFALINIDKRFRLQFHNRQAAWSQTRRFNDRGAIFPFPTKLLEFCWQKADRFCASASFKLQPGSEQLTTRQRLVGWQRTRLMHWFHYFELNQAESLFGGHTWISLAGLL